MLGFFAILHVSGSLCFPQKILPAVISKEEIFMAEEIVKSYVFDRGSDDARRVMNQNGVRARMPKKEESEGANACWDAVVAPDGRLYYPLSSENGFCKHTKLAYFDYDKDEVVVCFDAADVLLHPIRKLPHSKFHTCSMHQIFICGDTFFFKDFFRFL